MYVLFFTIALIWLLYFIGYPIYKKLFKKQNFNWLMYALVLNGLALLLNIVNVIIKCMK